MIKFAAAILTALAFIGAGWAIVAFTRPIPNAAPASDAPPALKQQLKASEGELLHLRGLEKTLDRVNRLTASTSTQSPMAILASHDSQPKTSAKDGQKQAVAPEISLVYLSPDLQKVVINGKLLGVGDMLPGGGRLIAITQEHIVVERHGRRSVLRLPKPHVLGIASKSTNAR